MLSHVASHCHHIPKETKQKKSWDVYCNAVVPNWQPQSTIDNLMTSLRGSLAFFLTVCTPPPKGYQASTQVLKAVVLCFGRNCEEDEVYLPYISERFSVESPQQSKNPSNNGKRAWNEILLFPFLWGVMRTWLSIFRSNGRAFFPLWLWNYST